MTAKTRAKTTTAARRKKPCPGDVGNRGKMKDRDRPSVCPACGKPAGGRSKACPACGAILDPSAVRQG